MGRLMRLKDQMSDYYQDVLEMETLLEIEQFEFDNLQSILENQSANQFLMTADINGIKVWESMVGITSTPNLDLESRRYNVLAKLLPPKPLTIKYLRELLSILNINATVSIDSPFHLDVKFSSTDEDSGKRLDKLLKQVVPANLAFNSFNILSSAEKGDLYVGAGLVFSPKRTNTSQGGQ